MYVCILTHNIYIYILYTYTYIYIHIYNSYIYICWCHNTCHAPLASFLFCQPPAAAHSHPHSWESRTSNRRPSMRWRRGENALECFTGSSGGEVVAEAWKPHSWFAINIGSGAGLRSGVWEKPQSSGELTSTTPVYVLAVDVWIHCGTEWRFALF